MNPRLEYLNNAAQIVNSQSPGIAAFLQSRIDAIVSDGFTSDASADAKVLANHELEILSRKRNEKHHICGACGHMLAKSSEIEKTASSTALTMDACFECPKCNARTDRSRTRFPKDQTPPRKDVQGPSAKPTSAQEEVKSKPIDVKPKIAPSTTVVKKPRAKKGASLSAIIAKGKQDASSNKRDFGLDLMDLMKSA